MKLRLGVTLLAFVAALLYFSVGRDYPPSMALLVALALAALVYTAQGTGARLRRIHEDRPHRQDGPGNPRGGGQS